MTGIIHLSSLTFRVSLKCPLYMTLLISSCPSLHQVPFSIIPCLALISKLYSWCYMYKKIYTTFCLESTKTREIKSSHILLSHKARFTRQVHYYISCRTICATQMELISKISFQAKFINDDFYRFQLN